eukprot:scaffold10855_cov308-Chaetoceros_neogracile.AAC.3
MRCEIPLHLIDIRKSFASDPQIVCGKHWICLITVIIIAAARIYICLPSCFKSTTVEIDTGSSLKGSTTPWNLVKMKHGGGAEENSSRHQQNLMFRIIIESREWHLHFAFDSFQAENAALLTRRRITPSTGNITNEQHIYRWK